MKVFSLFELSGNSDCEARIHYVINPLSKTFFHQTEKHPIMAFHNIIHIHNAEHWCIMFDSKTILELSKWVSCTLRAKAPKSPI